MEVPYENYPHSKTQNRDVHSPNDFRRQNQYYGINFGIEKGLYKNFQKKLHNGTPY